MSSRKRKIAMLHRLDTTYMHLYLMSSPRGWRLWKGVIVLLGDAMQRKGWPAWQARVGQQLQQAAGMK